MSFNESQTLRTAERHLSRGKTTAAIEEYRKLADWNPSDLTILNRLGDLYVRAGLKAEAKPVFSLVAQGYALQGFTSKAIALLKKILRIDPADLDSAAQLAECYLSQGLRGEAIRRYTDVAAAYRRAGQEDKARDAYKRMSEIESSNTSAPLTLSERWQRERLDQMTHSRFMAAGEEYSRQGDSERALAAYLRAQAVQPDEHKTLAAIASICVACGEAGSAVTILREYLSRSSGDAGILRILGSTYLSAGRLEDAERTFQRLLTVDSSDRSLLTVGEKFLENGDLDRAVKHMDGLFDVLITNRNEQVVIDFLNKVLDCDPEHLPSLRKLALIFRRIRDDYRLVPTLNALSEAALRRGDQQEAIEALEELSALEPYERAHEEALRGLGVNTPANPYAVLLAEDPSEYAADIEMPDNALRAALDLSRRGQTDGALALLKSMIREEPDNLALRLALKQVYSNAGLLELAANECMQIGRISQERRRPFSTNNISLPIDPSERYFEVVDTSNRRRTPRVSLRVPLIVISDTGGWREFTETVDVSEEGLRVKLAHRVPPMTMLRVSLEMAKWPESVARMGAMNATKGIVRYCRTLPDAPNLVGVELG